MTIPVRNALHRLLWLTRLARLDLIERMMAYTQHKGQ